MKHKEIRAILSRRLEHRDAQTWKVAVNGQQIGFVFKTRFSWGFCNARAGGIPKTWMSADVKSQAEAVEKLLEWDSQALHMAAEFIG